MLRATVLKPRRAEMNTVVLIKIVHTTKKDADLKTTSQMCLSQPLNKNRGRYALFDYYSRFSNFVALFAVAARFTISGQI
jgi:hypothetical protein